MTPRFRHDAWTAASLAQAKGALAISLVIPAKDEATTITPIVTGLRESLVEDVPLVDELVVIDSDSTDDTAARARAAGAVVHAAADIRPDLGPARGKGEALWKSLLVTRGDVLVFVDADLLDWGPHFVVGLLGPVLTDPTVQLVKAVYDRPMVDAQGHEEEAGGRVTELVARPLLALHRPQLADVVQPLSGEWAIRRRAFESFSVPTGYGVEIGALLDVEASYGPAAIAQVDLGRRTHRHHRHDALGQMALQVMAAAERRVGSRGAGWRGVTEDGSVRLRQFAGRASGFEARDSQVAVTERPPARDVAAPRGERR